MSSALVLSAGAAAAVLASIHWSARGRTPGRWPARASGWLLTAVACAPVAALYGIDELRLISFHGFFHTSIAYRIGAEGLAPGDPLFAGAPLLYPWAHHALVSWLSQALQLSPPDVFAALNVAALAGTLAAVSGIARTLFGDRATSRAAAALALYGLAAVPVALVLAPTGVELESRLIPVQKFANTNSNGIGLLCFALGALAVVRAIDGRGRGRARASARWLALLFAASLAGAWLYPLTWAPLAAATGGAALLSAARPSRAHGQPRRVAVALIVVVGLAAACAWPYLAAVQLPKSRAATIALDASAGHLLRNLANLALVALGWLALLPLARADLAALWRERPGAATFGALVIGLCALAFCALHAAIHSEYKFLMLADLALAIPAARAVTRLHERSAVACFALLWLLLWPAGRYFEQMIARDWRGGLPAVAARGPLLVIGAPEEAALHEWIRASTPVDAVFVDRALSIPPFAQRPLFVAFDPPLDDGVRAGWGLTATQLLRDVIGHPADEIARRRRIAARLLAGDASALRELRAALGAPEAYAVARSAGERARLSALGLERVYANDAVAVYATRRADGADAP